MPQRLLRSNNLANLRRGDHSRLQHWTEFVRKMLNSTTNATVGWPLADPPVFCKGAAMLCWRSSVWAIFACHVAMAAEIRLDFTMAEQGKQPGGFVPILAGEGRPGQWEVTTAEVAPALAPSNPQANRIAIKPVLSQLDTDPSNERFPMLVYDGEEFADFTVRTRLRLMGGQRDQMAGLVFRLQDAENFYVARVSVLDQNIRFYKVTEGLRGPLIGPSVPLQTNTWYELEVRCEGNRIVGFLDGTLVLPELQDTSFSRGKIGFWTKSDSICQFDGAFIDYTPVTPLSEELVRAALDKYSRVVDLRLYAFQKGTDQTAVVACKHPVDKGTPGGEEEAGALQQGTMYCGKGKKTVTVVMPVRDRNGDPVAAMRVVMNRFPGQTENNAVARAKPIVDLMEERLAASREAFQ